MAQSGGDGRGQTGQCQAMSAPLAALLLSRLWPDALPASTVCWSSALCPLPLLLADCTAPIHCSETFSFSLLSLASSPYHYGRHHRFRRLRWPSGKASASNFVVFIFAVIFIHIRIVVILITTITFPVFLLLTIITIITLILPTSAPCFLSALNYK